MTGAATTQVIHRADPEPTSVMTQTGSTTTTEPEGGTPRWLIALIVILILGTLGALLWLFARDVLGGDEGNLVAVPDVVGERRRDAIDTLTREGLEVGDITTEPAPEPADAGRVLSQDPLPDEQVQPGTTVDLVVAEATTGTIPTGLAGQPEQDVLDALAEAGFTNVTSQDEDSVDVDEGNVIRTEPAEGTPDVPLDQPITVFVSSGAGTVTVPEVRCQSFNSAQNELARAGLDGVISNQTVALNPMCPNGNKVADQNPDPGAEVESGSTVTLYGGAEATQSPTPTST
jgi:serine/threonine-protein kinase